MFRGWMNQQWDFEVIEENIGLMNFNISRILYLKDVVVFISIVLFIGKDIFKLRLIK